MPRSLPERDVKVRLRPLRLLVAWVLSAPGLLVAALIVPGVSVDNFFGALAVTAVIAVLNAIVPPVLAALRLPFTIATTFLLVLIADALMLMAADSLTEGAISVDSFWWALVTALIASAVTTAFSIVAFGGVVERHLPCALSFVSRSRAR